MLGLGLSLTTGGVITPYYAVVANAFRDRVEADGGTVESMSCLKKDLKVLNPVKPPAVDADYQAILDRSAALGYTAPSAAQQTLQNTLVTDLKTAGVWDKLDVFYVFATDGDSDYATLNWKAPSSFRATKVSSPTFTPNQGFNGDGASSYLNTNWSLANDSVNFTETNASMGAWFGVDSPAGYKMGARDGFNNNMSVLYTTSGTNGLFRLNCDSTTIANEFTSASALHHDNRNGASSGTRFLDGSQTNVSLGESDPLSTSNMYIGAVNELDTAKFFTLSNFSIVFAGADLTSEGSDVYDALNTYMTAL